MSYCNRRLRAAVACALGFGSAFTFASVASAAEPAQDELLMQKIQALQDKVDALEAKQSAQGQKIDARDVDRTVDAIVQDADKRSQFMQSSDFTAGYSKGKFLIQSADGDFVLHPNFQFMPRFVANYRDGGTARADDNQDGFELRRMKFGADGKVFKDFEFNLLWATDRSSGNLVLEEAWAKWGFSKDWAVRFGQFKDPFAHESLTSSKRLLAADRTYLNDIFTGGDNFVQGVTVIWDDGEDGYPIRAEFGYTDGSNNPNQNFQDFPTTKWDYGVAGRVEYMAFGKWKEYEDFSAIGNSTDLLVFGAGVDFSEAGQNQVLLHTFDAQYETGALGLYGAYLGRSNGNLLVGTGAAATRENVYDYGFIAQAAYLLPSKWEPFARWDYLHFDADGLAGGLENDVHEFTVGANYYLQGHAAKFTIDFTWLPNGAPIADGGADILVNNGDNEFLLRAQFQLLL